MAFEYSVIAAPNRGEKAKDAKTPTDRYALALTTELNRMAKDGWEYLRADVLPSEERSGLTGRSTIYHNVLVFRRVVAETPETLQAPTQEQPSAPEPQMQPDAKPDAEVTQSN
ncbi:DUF4177 domain-containing protein [Paracoccus sp. Z330]|uniref:DUF4177 domain-containing protein n=1 Tax=Paracoccus onchidii TaxID=3017813 RepID=A0ABT4Z9K3_9RHOB|nr:DUF4177 domain-containing protein [Paracoccus onchidii]MDB6176023.1 DUF4177 domain-containing protein [Paracoccus onchidii]